MTRLYKCDVCGRSFDTEEQAIACEKAQTIISAQVFGNSMDKENHPIHINMTFANGEEVIYESEAFTVDVLLKIDKGRREHD